MCDKILSIVNIQKATKCCNFKIFVRKHLRHLKYFKSINKFCIANCIVSKAFIIFKINGASNNFERASKILELILHFVQQGFSLVRGNKKLEASKN